MAKATQVLGMNAREKLYKSCNPTKAREIANSKLLTKDTLQRHGVPVPKLYGILDSGDHVRDFDYNGIETSFVIKPSGGSGGKGIMIIRKRGPKPDTWITIDGSQISTDDIRLHLNDILEGEYSTVGSDNQAFIEQRIVPHPMFKKYVFAGTADIRVLVYNQVPVMAMLRLPTKESGGRANLHQGAIGLGVDIGSGVTVSGVYKGHPIRYFPDSKIKVNGIKIPRWTATLRVAVEAAQAAGLAYSGVDLLMDSNDGPVVIELNASPGLAIQVANRSGLRQRLERIEGLEIRDTDHGVRVGKALFAESFADKVRAEEGLQIAGYVEEVSIRDHKKKLHEYQALLNPTNYRSQIDKVLATELGLMDKDNILWKKKVGKADQTVISVSIGLKGKRHLAAMSVVDLSRTRYRLVLGRLDLQGIVIDPGKTP